ncbi:MAG: hypothetical protein R2849_10800 [Thermomicrobiales bacterium]
MATLDLSKVPVVKAGMLIRRPVADVFEAFIDPEISVAILVQQRDRPVGVRQSGHLALGHVRGIGPG